jgi:hypothetical protein
MTEPPVDEASRIRLFPGIAFRGRDGECRAWVVGTALDVWQIVDAYRDLGSVERMVEGGSASERSIYLALGYCERYPAEIDMAIAENRRSVEQLRDEFPSITVGRT